MKNAILSIALSLAFTTGFSQNNTFEYREKHNPIIRQEKLAAAGSIRDINPDFCRTLSMSYKEMALLDELLNRQKIFTTCAMKNYRTPNGNRSKYQYLQEDLDRIVDYISFEISSTANGKTVSALSKTDRLTNEQKSVLNAAPLGSEVRIKVKFKYKNQALNYNEGDGEVKSGDFVVTIVPKTEAEYPEGGKELKEYLSKSVTDRIPEKEITGLTRNAVVSFIVNENGDVVEGKISSTSANTKIDRILLDAIQKMPKWKPATNSGGMHVKQQFSFPFGSGGC